MTDHRGFGPRPGRWEPTFKAFKAPGIAEPLPLHPVRAQVNRNGMPDPAPYVPDPDERAAVDAAATLAKLRGRLPAAWHEWHARACAARPPRHELDDRWRAAV